MSNNGMYQYGLWIYSFLLFFIVVKSPAILHAQPPTLNHPPKVVPRLCRDPIPRFGVVILDIQHYIQADDIHLFTWTLGRLQDVFENGIDFFGCGDTLGQCEQSLSLDSSPYS